MKWFFAIGFSILGIAVTVTMLDSLKESQDMEELEVDFSGIRIADVSQTDALVVGTTSLPVKCQVEYGVNGMFDNTASDSEMMDMSHTEHLVRISSLEPNTEYQYRFKAELDGRTFYSDVKQFTTK